VCHLKTQKNYSKVILPFRLFFFLSVTRFPLLFPLSFFFICYFLL
jgi:hypothetical protein